MTKPIRILTSLSLFRRPTEIYERVWHTKPQSNDRPVLHMELALNPRQLCGSLRPLIQLPGEKLTVIAPDPKRHFSKRLFELKAILPVRNIFPIYEFADTEEILKCPYVDKRT